MKASRWLPALGFAAWLALDAAAATAAPPPANPPFATFQSFCIAHDGVEDAAAAAADAAGWMTLPDSLTPLPRTGPLSLDSKVVRMRTDAHSVMMMIAGRGAFNTPTGAIPASICAVVVEPGASDAADQLAAWAKVPVRQMGGSDMYAFLDTAEGHIPVGSDGASIRDAALGGRLRIVATHSDPATHMLMMMYVVAHGRPV